MNMHDVVYRQSSNLAIRLRRVLSACLSVAMLLPGLGHAKDAEFPSYDAVYKSRISGLNVKMKRSLKVQGERHTLSMKAKKMMFGVTDHCEFDYDGNSDALQSVMYKHKPQGHGKPNNKHVELTGRLNSHTNLLTHDRPAHDLEFPTFDKLCHQAHVSSDLLRAPLLKRYEYKISNGSTGKDYA